MKKITTFLLVSVLISLSSCGLKDKGPDAIAQKFVKAVYTADFEKAKTLSTDESKEVIDLVATLTSEKSSAMKKAKVTYEVLDVLFSEDGNTATVTGLVKNSLDLETGVPIESREEKIKLVKVENQWLVDYKIK